MKVILTSTVPKVGKEGQVVKVANGYARNYLFPRGLAIVAEKNQLKVLEMKRSRVAARDASTVDGAQVLKEKLDGQMLRIEGKAGHETTKLFGAVTSQDIVDAIKSQLKVSIEKKQVALIDPIKRLGDHSVHLDLHREVDAYVTVQVFDPNFHPVDEHLPEMEALDSEAAEPAPAEAAPAPKRRSKKPAVEDSEPAEPAEAEPVEA